MATTAAPKPVPSGPPAVAPQEQVLPTLFGAGQGLYPQRKETFLYSFIVHMVAVGLLIYSGHWAYEHRNDIKQGVIGVVTDISPYLPLPMSKTRAGGGGGGGDRDKLAAPKGALPKLAKDLTVNLGAVASCAGIKALINTAVEIEPANLIPVLRPSSFAERSKRTTDD